jgi:hypothetical protein
MGLLIMHQAEVGQAEAPSSSDTQASGSYPCPEHKLASPVMQAQVLLVLAALLSHTDVCIAVSQQQQQMQEQEQGLAPSTSPQQQWQQQREAQQLARTLLHLLQPCSSSSPLPATVPAPEGQQLLAASGAGEKPIGAGGAAGQSAGRSSVAGDKAGQARTSVSGGSSRKGAGSGVSSSSNAKEDPGVNNSATAAGAAALGVSAPVVPVIVQEAALLCLEKLVRHCVWVQLLLQQQKVQMGTVPVSEVATRGRGCSATSSGDGAVKSLNGQNQEQQQQQTVSMMQQLLSQLQLLAAAGDVAGALAPAAGEADTALSSSSSSGSPVSPLNPLRMAGEPQGAMVSHAQADRHLEGGAGRVTWVAPAGALVTGLLVHAGVEQMEELGVTPALKVKEGHRAAASTCASVDTACPKSYK